MCDPPGWVRVLSFEMFALREKQSKSRDAVLEVFLYPKFNLNSDTALDHK